MGTLGATSLAWLRSLSLCLWDFNTDYRKLLSFFSLSSLSSISFFTCPVLSFELFFSLLTTTLAVSLSELRKLKSDAFIFLRKDYLSQWYHKIGKCKKHERRSILEKSQKTEAIQTIPKSSFTNYNYPLKCRQRWRAKFKASSLDRVSILNRSREKERKILSIVPRKPANSPLGPTSISPVFFFCSNENHRKTTDLYDKWHRIV